MLRVFGGYFLKLSIFAAVVFSFFYWGLSPISALNVDRSTFLNVFFFFYGFSALLHLLLLKLAEQKPNQFITYFMGITGLKLFIYLIILMVYLFLHTTGSRIGFIVSFFYLYITFTTFEVVMLLRQLNSFQEK